MTKTFWWISGGIVAAALLVGDWLWYGIRGCPEWYE